MVSDYMYWRKKAVFTKELGSTEAGLKVFLGEEQKGRLSRTQMQGAMVRSAGMVIIWIFSLAALFYGCIDFNSFRWASLSVALIILMHLPVIPVLQRITRKRAYEAASLMVNIMEIAGYTCFIYFVGGFSATYLTPIYAAMIFYVGVIAPTRYPFILAGISALAFGSMSMLEHFGFIPHQNVALAYHFEWNIVFLIIIIMTAMLFVIAFMSSYTGRSLNRAKIRLKAKNVELEIANEKLHMEIEERNRAYQALRESEEKLHDIFENVSDALFSHDLEGRFIETNLGMKRLLGYRDDEGLPEFLNLIDLAPERNKKEVDAYIHEVTKRERSEGVMLVVTKDGGERLVEYKNSLIRDGSGTAVGIRGSARDITEKHLADKERQKLQEQLQQAKKMEALGTLAGGVAHDLNNILSGIVSYPELLLMEVPEGSAMYKPLLPIRKSGEKAASIVQDLLTLARRGVSVSEDIDLNASIREYLKSPEYDRLIYLHAGIEVDVRLQEGLANISGSPVHMSKTIMNLVTNAFESITGGGEIAIETSSGSIEGPSLDKENRRAGEYISLKVSDTGVGMSEKDRERIFDPFYTKKVMGRSGTGLGLTVVWGTVKDMGGHIEVQSCAGKGTVFTLYFPAKAAQDSENVKASAAGLKDYSGKGEKILVVDDSDEQREIATGMLTKLGYSVTAVPSGEIALAYLGVDTADLVLLDMIMSPGMDGLDTYRKIIELQPGQKAIIASGYSETERVREAQKLGAGCYIRKPYLMENIGAAIREELDREGGAPRLKAS